MSTPIRVNAPVEFAGTADEKIANYRTHFFGGIDDRCFNCDCKPSHVAADYPCGTNPPRVWVDVAEYRRSIGL